MTWFDRKSPGTGYGRPTTFWVRLSSYRAVTRRRCHSRDRKWHHVTMWPELTQKWHHLTGSHLEVAVERLQLEFRVRLSSYRAVTCERWQSCDRKYRHVTGNIVTWPHVTGSYPEVTFFHRKSPGSDCGRPTTPVLCTLELLRFGNSQDVAVTWQEGRHVTSLDQK